MKKTDNPMNVYRKKMDVRIRPDAQGKKDVRFLNCLHDARFDLKQIRYARKRLTIPLERVVPTEAGWVNCTRRTGELIFYPVLAPDHWWIAAMGGKLGQDTLFEIIAVAMEKEVVYDDPWYCFHLKLADYWQKFAPSLSVVMYGTEKFPYIRYRDTSGAKQ